MTFFMSLRMQMHANNQEGTLVGQEDWENQQGEEQRATGVTTASPLLRWTQSQVLAPC